MTWRYQNGEEVHKGDRLRAELMKGPYKDVSELVAKVIEKECGGHFEGGGWRTFKQG